MIDPLVFMDRGGQTLVLAAELWDALVAEAAARLDEPPAPQPETITTKGDGRDVLRVNLRFRRADPDDMPWRRTVDALRDRVGRGTVLFAGRVHRLAGVDVMFAGQVTLRLRAPWDLRSEQ